MIKQINYGYEYDYLRYVYAVFPYRVYKYRNWNDCFHKRLINDNDIKEIIDACNPKFQNAFVSKVVLKGNKLDKIGFGQINNLEERLFNC